MSDGTPNAGATLAVHSGALGDLVLFGRLLSELPGPVTLVTGSEKGRLLAGLGAVDAALDFDGLPMHEIFSDTPLSECKLPSRLGTHERLISCFAGDDREAELRLAAMCGAGNAAFLPIRPPEGANSHLLALWQDLLGMPAPDPTQPLQPFEVPQAWRDAAGEELATVGVSPQQRLAVIHPGAGGEDKCWPIERFVALARRLERPDCFDPPLAVLLVLGPVECERWAEDALQSLGREFPVLTRPSLETLSAVLAAASLFVGNDSGVSHLAGAVGAPTVPLFGPTRAEHFSPQGPRVEVLEESRLAKISVEAVCAAAARTLHA